MNGAHLHLILNHLPILGVIFGLLTFAHGLFRKNVSIRTAGLVIFIVTALITFPAMNSGEEAEEIVEHTPGVDRHLIHEHEEAAEPASLMLYALGVASAAAWYFNRRQKFFALNYLVLVLALLSSAAMVRTGLLGGQIMHPEARSGYTVPAGHD